MSKTVGSTRSLASRGLRLLAIYAALIAVFVVSLTLVFALPQGRIIRNLRSSIGMLQSEGAHPRIVLGNNTFRLDNTDDAYWMDTAIVTQPGGPFVNAMGMFHGDPVNGDTIALLAHDLSSPRVGVGDYAYYWHGYQLFLRPALVVFTYGEIRYLNLLLIGLLTAVVMLVAARKVGDLAAGAFVFALLLAGFWSVPITFNYVSDMYLMLFGSLVVLFWADRPSFRDRAVEVFFVIGMLTAFFDNLTNPLITLGIPLAFVLIAFARNNPADRPKRDVWFALKMMVAWLVGYVASWATKWAVGTLVLKANIFKSGFDQFLFRAGATESRPRQLDAIAWNVGDLFPFVRAHRPVETVLVLAALALVVVAVVWLHRPAAQIRRLLPVLIVAPLPFAFYVVASNMALIHNWLMYRMLSIAVFSVVYFTLASIDFDRLGRRFWRTATLDPHAGADSGAGPLSPETDTIANSAAD